MTWFYKGKPLNDADIPSNSYGFTYIIRYANGMFYIGRKKLQGDWRGYHGSGSRVLQYIRKVGIEGHDRRIVNFYSNHSDLVSAETKLLTMNDAADDGMFYNIMSSGGSQKDRKLKSVMTIEVVKLDGSVVYYDSFWAVRNQFGIKSAEQVRSYLLGYGRPEKHGIASIAVL